MEYFATLESDKCADAICKRIDGWYDYLRTTKQIYLYHRVSDALYTGRQDGGQVNDTGARKEVKAIRPNVFRNAMTRFDSIIGSVKAVFKGRAANTDYSNLEQTSVIDDTFEHFQRKTEFNAKMVQGRRCAESYGETWGWVYWDPSKGGAYGTDGQTTAMEGDPVVFILPPTDIVRDPLADEPAWVCVKHRCNKWEYVAQLEGAGLTEQSEIAKSAKTGDFDRYREIAPIDGTKTCKRDDVLLLWHYYHKPSISVPEGRHMVIVDGGDVLIDTTWPRPIPVIPLVAERDAATGLGYSPSFDALAPYQAYCSLNTTAMTNVSQYGNPTYVSTGGKVNVKPIKDRFTIVELPAGTSLAPLESPSTPPEVYNYLQMLEQKINEVWGISVVQTGSEETIKSMPGNALALMESTTIRFAAPFQQSYHRWMERMAELLMRVVMEWMPGERKIEIAGKDNRPYMQAVTKEQLAAFQGFFLDIGNPALQTVQGNEQLARDLAGAGLVKSAAEYSFVRETGRVDLFVSPESEENMLMQAENEKIRNGENPVVLATDNHDLHIKVNSGPLKSPEARENAVIVEAGTAHLMEHIRLRDLPENAPIVAGLGGQPQGQPQGQPAPQPEQGWPELPQNPLTGQEFDEQTGGGVV